MAEPCRPHVGDPTRAGDGAALFGGSGTPEAGGSAGTQASDVSHDRPRGAMLPVARALYTERRRRERVFAAVRFGEPSWDILLDLFIAGEEGRVLQATSAALAACVPITTGRRYLAALEVSGLVDRHRSSADRRTALVRLSPLARNQMFDHLAALGRTMGFGTGTGTDT